MKQRFFKDLFCGDSCPFSSLHTLRVFSSGSLGSSFTFRSQFKRELALSVTLPSLHSPNAESWWSHLFLVWLSIVSFVIFRKMGGWGLSYLYGLRKGPVTRSSSYKSWPHIHVGKHCAKKKEKAKVTNHLGQSSEVRWLLGNQWSGKGPWQSKPILLLVSLGCQRIIYQCMETVLQSSNHGPKQKCY